MPSKSEADQERAEALADINEEGAPALLRYDRNWNAPGRSVDPDWVDIKLYVLSDGARFGPDQGILAGDQTPWIADAALSDEFSNLPGVPLGGQPAGTGFRILFGDPEAHPAPGGDGVQELRVLRILETVKIGGWPVIHRLHLRGGSK